MNFSHLKTVSRQKRRAPCHATDAMIQGYIYGLLTMVLGTVEFAIAAFSSKESGAPD